MTVREINRVVSRHPMYLDIVASEPVPVRLRDDLDPCDPPREYSDGRVVWSYGATSRQARDTRRKEHLAAQEAAEQRAIETRAVERTEAVHRLLAAARERAQTCDHAGSAMVGQAHCYTSSVARRPYTEQNPAAAGGVTVEEYCPQCRCARPKNVNGPHVEYGIWTPHQGAAEQMADRCCVDESKL